MKNVNRKEFFIKAELLAASKGGKLLSKVYEDSRSYLEWKCSVETHPSWQASYSSVKQGRWCKLCYKQRRYSEKQTYEEAKEVAISRGGHLLSRNYTNSTTPLEWKCAKAEHPSWKASFGNIKRGSWCRDCALDTLRLDIGLLKDYAKSRGGELLSENYTNKESKYLWKCSLGHEWEASAVIISTNRWCPICSTNVSEQICRYYLETIFKAPFPSKRPLWLKVGETQYVLDGYCEPLKIAFEHHGLQHYTDVGFFHKKRSLNKIQTSDSTRLCVQSGVRLIIIPALFAKTSVNELPSVILSECKRLNIKIEEKLPPVDLSVAYGYVQKQRDETLRNIIESRGGIKLSSYINTLTKIKVKCSQGHIWDANWYGLTHNSWCGACKGSLPHDLKWAQDLAASRGGLCLASTYQNSNTKMEWQCGNGHRWFAKANAIQQGKWCLLCSRQSRSKKSCQSSPSLL